MLYNYPSAACADNWLHQCLLWMLIGVHDDLRTGKVPLEYSEAIPAPYRELLSNRPGLRSRYNTFAEQFSLLPEESRDAVRDAFVSQNRVRRLLNASCSCTSLDGLSEAFRESVSDLYRFAFDLLTGLRLRDRQYQLIHDANTHHVCPFCGLDRFDAPSLPRHGLDHYLNRTKYPFAGANLRNLVPMCDRCNESYKATADLLWKDGVRRPAFDPYADESISLSLINSAPFGGSSPQLPLWRLDFEPYSAKVDTWDDVFHIRQRYVLSHLDVHYFAWINEFTNYCTESQLDCSDENGLNAALTRYVRIKKFSQLRDREFLKAAVFEFIQFHCVQGNAELKQLVRRRL